MEYVTAYENLRGLVYSPFYIGLAEGLFKEAGVELTAKLSPAGEETVAGAIAGRVEVSWGGPMRVMREHDKDPSSQLVCFGLAVQKDPFLIIGAKANTEFTPANLLTKRLAVATTAPTPWLLLQEDLRRLGFDPSAIELTDPVDPQEALEGLNSRFDYVLAFEPWGSKAELEKRGFILYAGARRGPLAFTSFYGPRNFLTNRRTAALALMDGLKKSLSRINSINPAEAATKIKPWFDNFDEALLAAAIGRYQRLNLWPLDTDITADGFVRLKSSLISGGFIETDAAYENIVANF
ncbi:MAG: ABC transporter substrate-binding protein [Alphaproteobacteria bacterium]